MLVVVGRMDEGMSHLILLSVPLFVFLGLLDRDDRHGARHGRLSRQPARPCARRAVTTCSSARCTWSPASRARRRPTWRRSRPVLFPEMKERGAKPGDLVALLSATGAQTETIPPSLVLITIGSVTGVSIAALFTGGMLPGVVLGDHACARGVVALPRRRPVATCERATRREIGRALRHRHSGASRCPS